MYNLISIITKQGRAWTVQSNTNILVKRLLNDFDDTLITVTTNTNVTQQIRLSTVPNVYGFQIESIQELINLVPDASLPALPYIHSLSSVSKLHYADIAEYQLSAFNSTFSLNPNVELSNSGLDIRLVNTTDTALDFIDMSNNMVFMVSGRIMRHTLVGNNIYIRGGVSELNSAQDKNISLLNFSSLGGYSIVDLNTVPVAELSIKPYESTVVATLPSNLANKSVLLVLDGLLHIFDGSYIIENDKLHIQRSHRRLIELAESKSAANLSWVLPAKSPNSGFDISTVSLKDMLATTESFLIVLDNPDISVYKEVLGRVGLDGKFTHYRRPTGILKLEDGTIADYMVTEASDYEVQISASLPRVTNKIANTNPIALSAMTDNSTVVNQYNLSLGMIYELYVFNN